MLPGGGLLFLACLAAWGLGRVRDNRAAAATRADAASPAASAAAPSPFADMVGEAGAGEGVDPFAIGATGANPVVGDEVWAAAEQLAAQAEVLYQSTLDAKAAGDRTLMVKQGKDAIQRFQTALEDSEPVELSLVAKHGETDPKARHVVRARKLWFQRVVWLHKSALH